MSNESNTQASLENPFWQFSLEFWRNDAAKHALLELQDQHGQQINLLLFAIWLCKDSGAAIAPLIEQAYTLSQQWQNDIVTKLRSARRALPESSSIKSSILNVELEAEKIEQAVLFDLSQKKGIQAITGKSNISLMLDNLKSCIEQGQTSMNTIPTPLIIALLQAAFPTQGYI